MAAFSKLHRIEKTAKSASLSLYLRLKSACNYVANHLSGDVTRRRVEYQRYKAFLDPFQTYFTYCKVKLSIECSREVCWYECRAPSSRQRDISSSAWLASMLRVRDNMANLTESQFHTRARASSTSFRACVLKNGPNLDVVFCRVASMQLQPRRSFTKEIMINDKWW